MATAKQNSPFSSLTVAVTIASTHCGYPRRDGQAELVWVAGYVVRQFTYPKAVTHPSTNWARCRATALIETNALPLHQTATSLKLRLYKFDYYYYYYYYISVRCYPYGVFKKRPCSAVTVASKPSSVLLRTTQAVGGNTSH